MGFGLQAFDLGIVTRRLELPEISADKAKPLTLIVGYCGVGTSRFDNAMFRRALAKGEDEKGGDAPLPADALAKMVARDAETNELIAVSGSVSSWENVLEDGHPAACMPDAVQRFLTELREHCPAVWRRIVSFVVDRENFGAPARIDSGDLGKT